MDYSLSISSLSSFSSLSLSSSSSSSDLEDLNCNSYTRSTSTLNNNSDPSCSPMKRNPSLKNNKYFDGLRPGLAGILTFDGEMTYAVTKTDQKHFLDVCSLCNKRIGRNRDIFMYRGNTPFCSEECRNEQIERDEARERITKASSSKKNKIASKAKKTTGSIDPRVGGTVVVAG